MECLSHSKRAKQPQQLSEAVAAAVPVLSLSVMLCYPQHSSLLLPISVKYLWIFMLRLFLAEVYQTPLLKVKTFGDAKGGEEMLVPRARDREQVYWLGFFLWGDQETTAPPEHTLSS